MLENFISEVYNVAWMNEGLGSLRGSSGQGDRTSLFLKEPDFKEALLRCLHS